MFRLVGTAIRGALVEVAATARLAIPAARQVRLIDNVQTRHLSFASGFSGDLGKQCGVIHSHSLLKPTLLQVQPAVTVVPARTNIKFSKTRGKKKTVRAVIKRFYRMNWGGWIRPRAGRFKKKWKKSAALKLEMSRHVYCNGAQSNLLDSMVCKYWRRPKYFPEDIYAPYEDRTTHYATRRTPFDYNTPLKFIK